MDDDSPTETVGALLQNGQGVRQLRLQSGKRTAGHTHRRQIVFQIKPVQFQLKVVIQAPVQHRPIDGKGLSAFIDNRHLQFRTDALRALAKARLLQEMSQGRQTPGEPFLEAAEIVLFKLLSA
jgi:hypothetical protein